MISMDDHIKVIKTPEAEKVERQHLRRGCILKKLEIAVNYCGSRGARGIQLKLNEASCSVVESDGVGGKEFSMSCHFKNYEDDFCWSFTRVYGPTLKVEREGFWSELGAVRGFWSDLWCVVDNFNMIRFPSERSKGGHLSLAMRRFSEDTEVAKAGEAIFIRRGVWGSRASMGIRL
ncbi:hypothetical protein CK203_027278 [Vitis vinifera]|uniref:Uncharacterized protein n=1 Tax=Vitis vinifera TaxID=29760 RepID=A0A438J9F9_VITVI|nr:hypothetical protein CK203_027278 [Vitis vinifera]